MVEVRSKWSSTLVPSRLAATVVEESRRNWATEAAGSRKVMRTTVPWPRALPTLITQVLSWPSEPR